ncbi:aldehyde dehydrogenase family protein [Phycicoccus sp. CSK15P-2]|uniref:aldehyde dehydrogenase family protein n=1 Tax=Phycicoccus sp. CSK15P-2 TaxID=2807627 RepID=UPI00195293A7|nr:aldehyde dehydrogenase family protein [Phycicoccus sp. CSK15P-2]MBM6405173.1 aldehyde dehydrogenase family protein [Phycicoccus sp. CSK15P-2]
MPDLFIDGTWTSAAAGGRRTITCPADGTHVGEVDESDESDTFRAIEAARRAADDGRWRDVPPQERAAALGRIADALERDTDEIARAEALDTGKRFEEAKIDVADVVSVFRHYAGKGDVVERVREVDPGQPGVVSRVHREPIGVCSLITPWNYPLLQASWKVAPALLAGDTFVLKPSEITPHSTILMVRAVDEAGVPAGVANLVLGTGPGCAGPLSTDPRVDMVSFTGSLAVGQHLMREAAGTVKRVALELGGKNPNIVFADADRKAAVDNAMTAVFLHSGQVCSAGARLLVEGSVKDEVVDTIVERAQHIRLGTPFDENAQTGSLTSAEHLAKVEDYVAEGIAEGATLRCGGARPDDPALADGHYYLPTVLDDCRVDMHVVQEESFGPVLTVETFRTEEEAVALANGTRYGLAGAVWTGNPEKAARVARGLRLGTVWVNDYHPYVAPAEWGGHKQSGIGRELGELGLEEYQETKHVWENTEPAPTGWFS